MKELNLNIPLIGKIYSIVNTDVRSTLVQMGLEENIIEKEGNSGDIWKLFLCVHKSDKIYLFL